MTEILVLLCLTVAGLELYMGLGRRRPSPDSGRISELEAARAGLEERLIAAESRNRERDAAVAALVARLDSSSAGTEAFRAELRTLQERLEHRLERGLQEERADSRELSDQVSQLDHLARALEANVSALRDQVRELVDRLEHEITPAVESMEGVVGRVHAQVQDQLDSEITETLGGGAAGSGTLAGALSGDLAPLQGALPVLYARLLDEHDLRVRLQVAETEGLRYYLGCSAGRGPVELEWDFMSLLDSLRGLGAATARPSAQAALRALLLAMRELGKGFLQLGPLVIVRTPDSLVAGVLSVTECRQFDTGQMLTDIPAAAVRLQALPDSRFHDLTDWPESTRAA